MTVLDRQPVIDDTASEDLQTLSPDIPVQVGLLCADGKEPKAVWYTRKPIAFEVVWNVEGDYPRRAHWDITAAVEYDKAGHIVQRHWMKLVPLGPGDELRVSFHVPGIG